MTTKLNFLQTLNYRNNLHSILGTLIHNEDCIIVFEIYLANIYITDAVAVTAMSVLTGKLSRKPMVKFVSQSNTKVSH